MRPYAAHLMILLFLTGLAGCVSWEENPPRERVQNGWLSWAGPVVDSREVARSGGALSWPDGPEAGGEEAPREHDFRTEIVRAAVAVRGRPYRLGANGPRAFDCSGLIQYAYRQAGIQIPRDTSRQFRQAHAVDPDDMREGDVIFFAIDGIRVSHVGLYAGDGRFLHSPSPGKRVSWANLDNDYWASRFAGVGRF